MISAIWKNFVPVIDKTLFKGLNVTVSSNTSVGKLIRNGELDYTITVWGRTLYLTRGCVEKCIKSWLSLFQNDELENELNRKRNRKVISMQEYFEEHPLINPFKF
ncbi:MAG: hypothetical protein AB2L24_11610 [Mangrovibacterium sp.]